MLCAGRGIVGRCGGGYRTDGVVMRRITENFRKALVLPMKLSVLFISIAGFLFVFLQYDSSAAPFYFRGDVLLICIYALLLLFSCIPAMRFNSTGSVIGVWCLHFSSNRHAMHAAGSASTGRLLYASPAGRLCNDGLLRLLFPCSTRSIPDGNRLNTALPDTEKPSCPAGRVHPDQACVAELRRNVS